MTPGRRYRGGPPDSIVIDDDDDDAEAILVGVPNAPTSVAARLYGLRMGYLDEDKGDDNGSFW